MLLKSLGATTVSVGIIGEPVLAIVLAYLVLGETITSFQLLGGMITVFGQNRLSTRFKAATTDSPE
ncbi:EamA family transporter [Paenibacillus phyllosphaerae]|uniref:EamA family transporter n=1 Tax=Paenibacillus phyllosphaerae TaxID=274593 RepID=UPI001FEC4636|nr:EamA family transporter [Paenibacillus phyllosphaerae]